MNLIDFYVLKNHLFYFLTTESFMKESIPKMSLVFSNSTGLLLPLSFLLINIYIGGVCTLLLLVSWFLCINWPTTYPRIEVYRRHHIRLHHQILPTLHHSYWIVSGRTWVLRSLVEPNLELFSRWYLSPNL